MKFSAVILFAIGAFALPQEPTITNASATPTAVPSGLSPAISCAMSCDDSDVTCKAACLGNARPNASQAIETNECAAKCDQGSGSTEDSIAYAKCVDSCINSLFPSSQTAFVPGAGGAVASGSASGAASAGPSATGSANPTATSGESASATGSQSGSAAGPASTGAADKASARFAGAGLAGLLAVFVL